MEIKTKTKSILPSVISYHKALEVSFKSELCDSSTSSALAGPYTPLITLQRPFLSKGSQLILHYQELMINSLTLFLVPFDHSLLISKIYTDNKWITEADKSVSSLEGSGRLNGRFQFSMLCPFPASSHNTQISLPKSPPAEQSSKTYISFNALDAFT